MKSPDGKQKNKQNHTMHRLATGFKGKTVREGIGISTTVDEETYNLMRRYSKAMKISKSEWIRHIIYHTVRSAAFCNQIAKNEPTED